MYEKSMHGQCPYGEKSRPFAAQNPYTRTVESTDIALNEPGRATASADTAGLRSNTFFEPDQEEIAGRTYDLYLARGQVNGHEMDDWIEAKRQVLEESRSA